MFIIFLLRMIFLLTMLVRMIDIYSFVFFGRNPLLSFPLFVLCSWFSSVLPIECPYISLSPKLSPALPA